MRQRSTGRRYLATAVVLAAAGTLAVAGTMAAAAAPRGAAAVSRPVPRPAPDSTGTPTSAPVPIPVTPPSPASNPKKPTKLTIKGWKAACGKPSKKHAACQVLVDQGVTETLGRNVSATTNPPGYGPADLKSAYNLPVTGTTATVAIVDAFHDPNAASDLAAYRAQYGLPACTAGSGCFRQVAQDGSTSYPPVDSSGGWEVEESLDVDMVSAICPTCHILLVEATDNSYVNLGTAVNEAVSLGAKYVSNSYGGGEFSGETSLDTYYNHPGVAVTASAGDSGYGPQYPAASLDVVAVGGTSLTHTGTGTRGWSETVWSGAGSGCSGYEAKPSWQTDTGCADRTIGDVSAVADPNTGVAIYDTYPNNYGINGFGVVGGTSVASPVIASVYALGGTPGASSYPAQYIYKQHGAAEINDITSGSNGSCSPAYLCTGETGYDGPTGWGTPWSVAAFQAPGSVPSGPVKSGIAGKCLDDYHSGTANFNKIDTYSCNGTAAQVWGVEVNSTLRNVYSGKCLDVSHSGTANGSLVDLYQCNNTAAQVWKAQSGELVNPHSGKCLTDPSSGVNGTQLELETCVGTTNQLWTLP